MIVFREASITGINFNCEETSALVEKKIVQCEENEVYNNEFTEFLNYLQEVEPQTDHRSLYPLQLRISIGLNKRKIREIVNLNRSDRHHSAAKLIIYSQPDWEATSLSMSIFWRHLSI